MTHPGAAAGRVPDLSAADRSRLDAKVEDLLTSRALSDEDAAALVDSVVSTVLPAPTRPAPRPRIISDDGPEPDWAADQEPPAPIPPMPTGAGLGGGGGSISAPARPSSWRAPDDDDDDEKYPLWRPPPRPPIEVPEDVTAITPVFEPDPPPFSAGEEQVSEPAAVPPRPSNPHVAPGSANGPSAMARVRGLWSKVPSWGRVALAVGVVVSLLVVQQIVSHSRAERDPSPAASLPPAVVETESPQGGEPAEAPLQPGCAPNSAPGCLPVTADACPGGSSDPALAFGSDPSQAWTCGRANNIDLQQITIQYPRPVVVTQICVVPGFAFVEPNGEDRWLEHRLVTAINWRLGGEQFIHSIKPTREGSCWDVPRVATQVIIGTVLSSERPPASSSSTGPQLPGILGGPNTSKVDESIAISRITVNGYPAGAG